MEFAPTKLKVLVSAVIGLAVGVFSALSSRCYDCPASVAAYNSMVFGIGFFAGTFIMAYFIWSGWSKRTTGVKGVISAIAVSIGGILLGIVAAIMLGIVLAKF